MPFTAPPRPRCPATSLCGNRASAMDNISLSIKTSTKTAPRASWQPASPPTAGPCLIKPPNSPPPAPPPGRAERHRPSIDYLEPIRAKRCVIQGNAQGREYGPADPSQVQEKTRNLIETAKALGITNLREDYPLDRQVQDWGDVGAHYRAVVIASHETAATVIPELGRVITFGRLNSPLQKSLAGRRPAPQADESLTDRGGAGLRPAATNVLRVPDPGEWAYPHAGGI